MTEIFVFGSNLAGRHGRGAARAAWKDHGALAGKGFGPMGKSYAIPTKDERLRVLALYEIKPYVDSFLAYAQDNPDLRFRLTPIGCGLAGYKYEQIAPMFRGAPKNVIIPEEFAPILRAVE